MIKRHGACTRRELLNHTRTLGVKRSHARRALHDLTLDGLIRKRVFKTRETAKKFIDSQRRETTAR